MRDNRKLALSSLAVSVSAAALIGVSNVAKGDSPGMCFSGSPCSLYYGEHLFFFWPTWVEGGGAIWEDIGTCGWGQVPGQGEQCGCSGWSEREEWHYIGGDLIQNWYMQYIFSPLDPQCWNPS